MPSSSEYGPIDLKAQSAKHIASARRASAVSRDHVDMSRKAINHSLRLLAVYPAPKS